MPPEYERTEKIFCKAFGIAMEKQDSFCLSCSENLSCSKDFKRLNEEIKETIEKDPSFGKVRIIRFQQVC